jgi:hypothetical protein
LKVSRWQAGLMLALLLGAGVWAYQRAQQRAAVERGDRLFHGEAALSARIVGHTMALPATVSRCMNCHETRSTAVSAAASAVAGGQAGRYGPALDHATLAQPQARRGGPPSRYDAPSLCTLVRTGVDPAQVMIPQTMPHYEIGDADCAALWAYLISR